MTRLPNRDDRFVPASDWDLSTRDGETRAYRLSVSEAGGERTQRQSWASRSRWT